jgi:two-component system sensor histidine kinase ChvG
MVQQGRLVAASLSGAEAVDVAAGRALVERLGGRSESRIRIADASGSIVADSAATPVRQESEDRSAASPVSRESVLYRIGAALWRPIRSADEWLGRSSSRSAAARYESDVTPRTIVFRALDGRYAATLRESAGQRSLTLYSALPIRAAGSGRITGAVIVSQSTSRILRALWRVRLHIFKVFVISVVVAAILSLLVSATIARPLMRLRDEADELLDHRGRLRRTFRGSQRKDEIGELTRALEKLTARLERHLSFVEGFSADVSHEFKNPLASIRNAAELLPHATDDGEKAQLAATIDKEVARLNRLIDGVREVSKIDAALDTESIGRVDVRTLLAELEGQQVAVSLPNTPLVVRASADRLMQALRNIVDNAVSFTPSGGRVRIALREESGLAVVRVEDDGPGIPNEHLEKIFDRFFTFRPSSPAEQQRHDGLGLAIAKAIVEGYGGSICASNLTPHGARIQIELPVEKG